MTSSNAVLERGPGYEIEETSSGIAVVSKKMTLEEAFPVVDPGSRPFGGRVLVQLRCAKKFSDGGIALPAESQDWEKSLTAVGKILALGPLAYKDRATGDAWPEGAWVIPGMFVRVPKWGGDRWEIVLPEDRELARPKQRRARFVIFNDGELISEITADPLEFVDYV